MKAHVLIADREPAIRETLQMLLEEEGYTCSVAGSGPQILSCISRQKFDLVLLDFELLGYSPYLPLLDKLRTLCPQSVIFILTSYARAGDAVHALRAGANRLIKKPIEFEELLEAVDSLRVA